MPVKGEFCIIVCMFGHLLEGSQNLRGLAQMSKDNRIDIVLLGNTEKLKWLVKGKSAFGTNIIQSF